MSTALAVYNDWQDKKDLIKATVCRGATDNEMELFLHTCKHVGLDPLMRQIYSIQRGGQRTIQAGIDGLRVIAERTGNYSPGKESTFQYKPDGSILSCTAYVSKRTDKGEWHEVSATAFFDEYVVKQNPIWKDKPHCMISKCAEALALRKAFPANMAGIYTNEEMGRAQGGELGPQEKTIEVEPVVSDKLSEDQILNLALSLTEKIEDKKQVIQIEPLTRYLQFWQEAKPNNSLVADVEKLGPQAVYMGFQKWIEKNPEKVA